MCGGTGPIWRPAFSTSVEPIRSIQLAVGRERRLVHVPAQDDVGPVLLDPRARAPRRRSAACPVQLVGESSGGAWYTQIQRRSPTSAASSASCRSTTSHVRGPSHHGHTVTSSVVGDSRRIPSTNTPAPRAASSHDGGTLAELVARVEVVVARARDDGRLRRDAREVLEHDRDLRVGLDDRRDVEVVAGDDDEVVVARDRHDPVELLQRVVQIGDDEDPQPRTA